MGVETEQRRTIGFEPTRPVTNHVASVVASARIPEDLDWQAFSATYFPGRQRHDLEALTAYCAYRSAQEVDAVSDGLARTEAERGPTGPTPLQGWEDEGGAVF